ncbi:ATP-binding cassette domain-containing protein [Lachnospiraceae bacterium 54-53]
MITFEHVSKTYGSGAVGLKNIDLTIYDGEFVSVIGLSGSGKSTLLRSVNRLQEITEGDIRINGVSVTKSGKKELRKIRRQIGFISQTFHLVKRSTVQKNVLSGRLGYYPAWKSILGIFSKADYLMTEEALVRVGLFDKLHSRSDELSGGQQQRVSIARALVQQADLILIYEAIETVDYGPLEAAESVGANKTQTLFWSVIPQILSQTAGYALYALEVNVRASTVLGYVGAGGIGIVLNTSLSLLRFDRVSVIILMILIVVTAVDGAGEAIGRRLK